ncbi:MAG: 50S ribosomal protein L5 [Ignavibacteriae bacterium]|jgi:large subunit ribosomal protein L5|nr:50S ribosomal protein L5 [Ignavibacteriota bacterium]NOG97585.1 50S ribosomal protein L5 [Ignavibacteriota bacterium]
MAKQDNKEKEVKKTKTKKTKKAEPAKAAVKVKPRLIEKYAKEVAPKLHEKFAYSNVMQIPKLSKIVVNMGVGGAVQDSKLIDEAVNELELITGQKASVQIAKQSISNFKLREGMKIGAKVTLRRERMYEFLDRLITIALPRVRDFRGVPDKSFDGRGNYTLGIKEQFIFPEINVDKVSKVLGMDITFVTTAETDKEAYELLTAFGVPFRKKEIN